MNNDTTTFRSLKRHRLGLAPEPKDVTQELADARSRIKDLQSEIDRAWGAHSAVEQLWKRALSGEADGPAHELQEALRAEMELRESVQERIKLLRRAEKEQAESLRAVLFAAGYGVVDEDEAPSLPSLVTKVVSVLGESKAFEVNYRMEDELLAIKEELRQAHETLALMQEEGKMRRVGESLICPRFLPGCFHFSIRPFAPSTCFKAA